MTLRVLTQQHVSPPRFPEQLDYFIVRGEEAREV